jgi:hypothetical protein
MQQGVWIEDASSALAVAYMQQHRRPPPREAPVARHVLLRTTPEQQTLLQQAAHPPADQQAAAASAVPAFNHHGNPEPQPLPSPQPPAQPAAGSSRPIPSPGCHVSTPAPAFDLRFTKHLSIVCNGLAAEPARLQSLAWLLFESRRLQAALVGGVAHQPAAWVAAGPAGVLLLEQVGRPQGGPSRGAVTWQPA